MLFKQSTQHRYKTIHVFGFIDFASPPGTRLALVFRQDSRMARIAALPLALTSLFGVGVSGTRYSGAFDLEQETPSNVFIRKQAKPACPV